MECKEHWKSLLDQLDSAIEQKKKKHKKRFSPISPTLPDRDSAFVLDRLNSIQVTEEEELVRDSRVPNPAQRKYKGPFNPKVSGFFFIISSNTSL